MNDRLRPGAHLDPLRLDAVRAGEGRPEELAHLDSCATCRRERELLESIAAPLRASAVRRKEIPPDVDRRILRAYRESMERAKRRRPFRLGWAIPALAAAALLALTLVPALRPDRLRSLASRAADPGDVNRDGTIDIRDAYLLALQPRPPGSAPALDPGGPRLATVDALARRAVALP